MNSKKKYTVAVVATMSAGKSTLLNAMLGDNLLPTKNTACTATIFRIEDHDGLIAFEGRYRQNDVWGSWSPVNRETLAKWNECGFGEIEIRGNLPGIKNVGNKCQIVLWDTPGPNNAMSNDHKEITKKVISQAEYCNLLCVLNATASGVKDEGKLLAFIKTEIAKAKNEIRPFFVLNKIDELDYDAGERITEIGKTVIDYIKNLGFKNPIVIPMCASLSLLIRQCLKTARKMTAREVNGEIDKAEKSNSLMSRYHSQATLLEWKQSELRKLLRRFDRLRSEYELTLRQNPMTQRALENLQATTIPSTRRKGKIKIAGTDFDYATLCQIDHLTGVPILEYLLEQKLNGWVKKTRRQK